MTKNLGIGTFIFLLLVVSCLMYVYRYCPSCGGVGGLPTLTDTSGEQVGDQTNRRDDGSIPPIHI